MSILTPPFNSHCKVKILQCQEKYYGTTGKKEKQNFTLQSKKMLDNSLCKVYSEITDTVHRESIKRKENEPCTRI